MDGLIRYANGCVSNKLAIIALCVVTAVFGTQLGRLGMNASPYIVESTHPLRQDQVRLSETFSNSGEQIMIVLNQGAALFERDSLSKITAFSTALETLSLVTATDLETIRTLGEKYDQRALVTDILNDGVNVFDRDRLALLSSILEKQAAHMGSADDRLQLARLMIRANPVSKVSSVTTVENLTDDDDFLMAEKLVETLPDNMMESNRLRAAALDNELYRHILLNEHGTVTNVQVELTITSDDSPTMILAYQAIRALIDEHQLSRLAYLSGIPVVNAEIAQVMDNDNKAFFPWVVLVILLILYVTFRRMLIVMSALFVAILTQVWTLGSMAVLGVNQNIVTAILPIFIISIAVADAIHYISAYLFRANAQNGDGDKNEAVINTNEHLMRPLLLTTMTTVFGFLALSYSDLVFIKEFGLFVGLGVVYAFLITITLLPFVLPRFTKMTNKTTKEITTHKASVGEAIYAVITLALFRVNRRHPVVFTVLMGVTMLAAVFFAAHVTVDNHSTASFDKDAKIRVDEQFITQYLGGGIYPVNFWFESEEERGMIAPETIAAIEKIQQYMNEFDQVGYSISPNDYLKRINKVVAQSTFELPSPLLQSTIAQFFLLYENSNGQDLRDVLDFTYRHARIVALFRTDQASQFAEVIERVRELAKETLPAGVTLRVTGYGAEIVLATELVVYGQLTSIVFAIMLIGGLMCLYYRSLMIAFMGILPLSLTIIVNYALLSVSEVSLDIGTALISGIAFGIGIDYAIHFISVFQAEYKKTTFIQASIEKTIHSVARPIMVNSLSLGLGFLMLSLSDFASLRQLGYFISASMVICALLTLCVLPLMLSRWGGRAFSNQSNEVNEQYAPVFDVK
jgi:predicted RND superfamily exporter protein